VRAFRARRRFDSETNNTRSFIVNCSIFPLSAVVESTSISDGVVGLMTVPFDV